MRRNIFITRSTRSSAPLNRVKTGCGAMWTNWPRENSADALSFPQRANAKKLVTGGGLPASTDGLCLFGLGLGLFAMHLRFRRFGHEPAKLSLRFRLQRRGVNVIFTGH